MKAKFKTNPEKFNTLSHDSEYETTTKEIMSEAFDLAGIQSKSFGEETTQRVLAKAFCAAHSMAAPAHRWKALGEALDWTELDPKTVQKVLTRMTRKGYLRSRMSNHMSQRLYEVNY